MAKKDQKNKKDKVISLSRDKEKREEQRGFDFLLSTPPTDPQRLFRVGGWGMAHAADCYLLRPSTLEQLEKIVEFARKHNHPITLRGSGQSYGDANIGQNAILLDFTRMKRILNWDPKTGIAELEPGVTFRDLWQYTIEDGWWPPVVTGTMFPTLGGALAMNVHGKNNYRSGPLGEHILEFDLLTPRGELITCSPQNNQELFYAAIGSFGVLGIFTRIKIQLKRIYSGELLVKAISTSTLEEMLEKLDQNREEWDYLVGWIDCYPKGAKLGRGLIHLARYLKPEEDPNPHRTLRVEYQELPETFFGFIPKSSMWLGMKLLKPFWRWVNAAKYWAGKREAERPPYLQSLAAFNFLLDYIPNWKWIYKPHGFIQYQTFVPKEKAREVFEKQLQLSQDAGIIPYLGVVKRHRPDKFLLSYSTDGYSLALDYQVTPKNRNRLLNLVRAMTTITLDAGGKFYFAKDGVLLPHEVQRIWPEETFEKFLNLKKTHDPQLLLESDLSRRIALLEQPVSLPEKKEENSERELPSLQGQSA